MSKTTARKTVNQQLVPILQKLTEAHASGAHSLIKAKLTHEAIRVMGAKTGQVAQVLQCSSVHVRDLLVLGGAPAPVQEAIASGKISIRAAIQLVRKDADKALKLISNAASDKKGPITLKYLRDPSQRALERCIASHAAGVMDIFKGLIDAPTPCADEKTLNSIKGIYESCTQAAARASQRTSAAA